MGGGKAMRRQCATLALCSVWLASSWSWAHAATASPFRGSPTSPRSLPADNVPAFGILDDNGNLVPMPPIPAGAPRRAPGTAPESTAPGPSLGMSVEAARAAIDACAAAGYRIGVAIIDSVGEARVLLTADGSDGSHVFVAMRKSLTALRFEMPSSRASELVPNDPELLARVTPNMFVMGGALPIMRHGEAIGAIGVSGAGSAGRTGGAGAIGQQDEVCAAAGLRKIAKQLE